MFHYNDKIFHDHFDYCKTNRVQKIKLNYLVDNYT